MQRLVMMATMGALALASAAWLPAQDEPAAPPGPKPAEAARPPGYEKLQMFVGRWTLEGREDRYLETCDWYDGRFTVVCNTTNRRADGTVSKGMSILGYLPEEDVYTYHGFNSSGRNETQRGTFEGSTFRVQGEAREGGQMLRSRVTITPRPDGAFTLVAESSAEGGPWTTDATIQYKRAR